jgi:hypothetical protein
LGIEPAAIGEVAYKIIRAAAVAAYESLPINNYIK